MFPTRPRLAIALGILLLSGYFLTLTYSGLFVKFHPDDLMNMHTALRQMRGVNGMVPLIWPFGLTSRPVGSLYYRIVYEFAGLSPLPFRLVTYGFLLVNTGLALALARRLSGSWEVAWAAALFWCYHPRFRDLYENNGTIYDILCFTAFGAALLLYTAARQQGRDLRWREALAVVLLFIAALNSKEMAATLPVILIAYEAAFKPGGRKRGTTAAILLCLGIAAGAALSKARDGSAFHGVEAYQVHFTVRQFFFNHRHYLHDLLIVPDSWVNTAKVVGLWTALLAAGIVTRRRTLTFAALFLIITPTPVIFIAPRNFFAMYLPYFGWALYAATALVAAKDRFLSRRRQQLVPEYAYAAMLVVMLAALRLWQSADPSLREPDRSAGDRQRIEQTIADVRSVHPCPAPGGRVLFLKDRWQDDNWGALMATRLVCHAPDLDVDLAWVLRAWHRPLDPQLYSYVVDYDHNHIIRILRPAGIPGAP